MKISWDKNYHYDYFEKCSTNKLSTLPRVVNPVGWGRREERACTQRQTQNVEILTIKLPELKSLTWQLISYASSSNYIIFLDMPQFPFTEKLASNDCHNS